ncbi:MAG: LEA type 2 family protein [Phycisphaerales bacterium]
MKRAATVLLVAGVCAGVVGCAGVKEPDLRVVEARVAERTAEGVVMHFVVEGENTNEKELPLLQAEYRVSIDGREVFRATRSPEATLRRKGVQRFVLPAAVPAQELGSGAIRWSLSGSVGYIAPERLAETLLDMGLPNPTTSVRGSGEIEVGGAG